MIPQISLLVNLYFKYVLFYLVIYLLGRSVVIIINYFYGDKNHLPNKILNTKSEYIYPLLGLVFLGNLLIIINYFLPLKSIGTYLAISFLLLVNFTKFNKIDFNIISMNKILIYIVIPVILLISTIDITFHYDAGYYHLNHQNWLRESNMVVGMVNIFWAFGMSSIYEYISAILWFDNSFVLLHILSLYFIHFLYIFLFVKSTDSESKLRYVSIFVLIFSLLDNVGISGGRNGFIYIQEVGKQDTAVAILFFVVTFFIAELLLLKKYSDIDLIFLSLISFFIFQTKLNGVFIYLLLIIFFIFLIRDKIITVKKILSLILPNFIVAVFWFVKSYLTTGCVVFPINFTCKNSFSWYLQGSTIAYQEISTDASFSYIQYLNDNNSNFLDWFNDFFLSSQYSSFSEYYRSYYTNFIVSISIIFIIKFVFFTSTKQNKKIRVTLYSFVIFNLVYLIFFGPIPRYSMGILTVFVGVLGVNVVKEKVNISVVFLSCLVFLSVFSLIRLGSYQKIIETADMAINNPEDPTSHYEEVPIYQNWIKPSNGDRCWVNLKCTMHVEEITLNSDNFFSIASR